MQHRTFYLAAFLSLFGYSANAQKAEKEFIQKYIGNKVYSLDTEASAVVLDERTDVAVTFNSYSYDVKRHVHKVIHILKADALSQANMKLLALKDNRYNYVNNIKGSTFNQDANGQLVETPLWMKDIFIKEVSEGINELAFTLPAVKPGSIIEYSYDNVFPLTTQLGWEIQEDLPKLSTAFSLMSVPGVIFTSVSHFTPEMKEYPSEDEARKGSENFCVVKKPGNFGGKSFWSAWIRKDVPAIKHEPLVLSLPNYTESFVLQVKETRSREIKEVTDPWEGFNKGLYESENFGKLVTGNTRFLNKVMDSLMKNVADSAERRQVVFNYVRNNFVRSDKAMMTGRNLDDMLKSKKGSVTEINLLLCAMLTQAGMDAAPLILNTTGNLSPTPSFPTLDRFNYTVCAVKVGNGYILLDASDKHNPYGVLPEYCYNGYARIINKEGIAVTLTPDMIKEKSVVSVNIRDITDTAANVEIIEKMGMVRSSMLRRSWDKDEKKQQKYVEEQLENLPEGFEIDTKDLKFADNPDTAMMVIYKGSVKLDKAAPNWYLSPVLVKPLAKNPLKATNRIMPIEFPFKYQYIYRLAVTLPSNMEPVDLHAPFSTNVDSGAISYNMTCDYTEALHTLTVNTTYKVETTAYPVSSYERLREFYQDKIKAENSIINIRKIQPK